MADIAQLGFSADTSELKEAKASIEALVPAADKAEKATDKLSKAFGDTASAADKAARGVQNATSSTDKAAMGVSRVAEGYDLLSGKMNKNFLAVNNNIRKMTGGVDEVSKAIKFGSYETLNFTRQLADIGTTAAMGMSPFMIAIQQGPQLLDILQQKAAETGATTGAVFRAAGVAIWTALAPLLPLILGITAVVGGVALAFGLAAHKISSDSGDVSKSMDLTKKQTEKLKDSLDGFKDKKINVEVSGMDTFKAFFVTVWQYINELSGGFSMLKSAWNSMLDFMIKYGVIAIKGVVGTFVGGYEFIKAAWSTWPFVMADIFTRGANLAIKSINWLVEKIVEGINSLGGKLTAPKLASLTNPFGGMADKSIKAFEDGYSRAGKAVDRFGARWETNARKIAQHRILKELGGPDHSKEKGSHKKDPWQELIAGANADIAKEVARGQSAALDMTAEASATLEQKTKLLNQAHEKGIKLTDAMRTKIDQLAAAYGKAKVTADNAVAFRDVMKAADADIANIKAQADMIGLYGRQLAYATEMQKLLNEAKQKGMTKEAIAAATPAFQKKAGDYADASVKFDHDTFMEQQRKSAEERRITLQQERMEIGMTADQVTRYRIENELLAQARQKNIDLTPDDIASIQAIAKEQADAENSIRKMRDAVEFARDTTRGFFTDFTNGIRQGQTLWQSFANAAVNALNKIIDKLLDSVLTQGLDKLFGGAGGGILGGLFGGSGGGSGSASLFGFSTSGINSGTFGSGMGSGGFMSLGGGFALGDVFDRPTAFAFGKGGSNLGIMGEAGPEAVMPLQRGPDGSLGVQMYGNNGGNAGRQAVDLNIKVAAVKGDIFDAVVHDIAQDEAANALENGLRQYDAELPSRFQQIAQDERVRG